MLFCSGVLSNVSLVWLPTIFDAASRDPLFAIQVGGAINIGAMLGMATAGRVLETFGARITIGIAFFVGACATAALGIANVVPIAVVIGALMGYFLGITTSAGYALSALIYPANLRGTGVGAAAAALRVGTLAAPLIIPIVLSYALSVRWTFMIIAIVPLSAALIASRFGKRAGSPIVSGR